MKNQTFVQPCFPRAGSILFLFFLLLFSLRTGAQTPLAYGQDVGAAIGAPGEVDTYSFAGVQGDRIVIRMTGQGAPFGPEITLKDPMGALAAMGFTTGNPARVGVVELLQSGTYLIEAREYGNNATGDYGLSLEKVNPAPNPLTLDCSLEIPATLDIPGEIDA